MLFVSVSMHSQDMHFSQFNETPALINPALTGVHGLRASLSYRSQWKKVATPYKSQGISFEMKTGGGKKKKEDEKFGTKSTDAPKSYLGYGLSLYKDKSGDAKMILNQINLSVAGFVPLGQKSYLSAGLQASYARRKMNNPAFIYPNQYVEGGYDSGIDSGEETYGERFGYLDFGAGFQWTYDSEERGLLKEPAQMRGHFGAAIYHITQPAQKLAAKSAETLLFKYVAHGDLLFSIKKSRVALHPSFLFQMQGKAMEITVGSLVKYNLNSNNTRYTNYRKRSTASAGFYFRTFDAVIFQGLYEFQERYAVGLSYDFNVSRLRPASHMRGGTELMLRFTPGVNESHYEKLEKK